MSHSSTDQTLIIINGAPGVGKSTVAVKLLQSLDNAIWVDGDDLWRIHPWVVDERNKALVEDNIADIIRNGLRAQYDYVILSWVMHRQEIIDRIVGKVGWPGLQVRTYTLVCDEGVLVKRLEARGGRSQGGPAPYERWATALDRLRQSRQLATHQIDSGKTTPEAIAALIRKKLL